MTRPGIWAPFLAAGVAIVLLLCLTGISELLQNPSPIEFGYPSGARTAPKDFIAALAPAPTRQLLAPTAAAPPSSLAPLPERASPSLSPPAAANHGGGQVPAGLPAALSTVASLKSSTLGWWAQHGPDYEQGGFYTTLDRFGVPQLGDAAASSKFLVPAARQLYTFSTLALKVPGDARAQALARRAHAFLTGSALWDVGEGLFRWQVSRDGRTAVRSEKVLYGQAFAILGLARFGRALGEAGAVDWAHRVFQKVDASRHDAAKGGYLEGMEVAYAPGAGIGTPPGADKSHNTHLHLVEALTELSRALEGTGAGAGDARRAAVDARLRELVGLLPAKLWQPGAGHIGTEFAADWRVLDPAAKLYGHEIELVYFLLAAEAQLGRGGTGGSSNGSGGGSGSSAGRAPAPPATANMTTNVTTNLTSFALKVGQAALEGYDARRGGFWTAGGAGGPTVADRCGQGELYKDWWPQFEGLSGLFWLWRASGDGAYWDRLLATLRVVAEAFHDPQGGEFYMAVTDDSRQPVCHGALKADAWKASYHAARALILLEEWLGVVRDGREPAPQV